MQQPIEYYLLFGGAFLIIVAAIALWLRKRRRPVTSGSPYVKALKLLVDGQPDEAFHRLQEAVKSGVAPTDAYIKLGELLRERGELNKALQIHQSLTVKTNLSRTEKIELFMNLADDYARMGNSRKAAAVLDSSIRNLGLRDATVYLTLAKHYNVLGEQEKAYDALREAQKLGAIGERELALFMTTVADALVEKGQNREARKMLLRAQKHDPNCASCLLSLGNLAERTNDLDEAIDNWKRVAILSPELSRMVVPKLERTLFDRGRFGEIERIYDDVRGARAGDESVTMSLAAFYDKQGRVDEAISLLEEFTNVFPGSVRASLMLTAFYAKHRDGDTLQDFLDKSVRQPVAVYRYECEACHFNSSYMRWHCPRCNAFDSFSGNHVG